MMDRCADYRVSNDPPSSKTRMDPVREQVPASRSFPAGLRCAKRCHLPEKWQHIANSDTPEKFIALSAPNRTMTA